METLGTKRFILKGFELGTTMNELNRSIWPETLVSSAVLLRFSDPGGQFSLEV